MLAIIAEAALAATLLCGQPQPPLLSATAQVRTEEQAIAIALKAAWKVYGKEEIAIELPLRATKHGAVWQVEGAPLPRGWLGGVVEITINASDGTIAEICHGK